MRVIEAKNVSRSYVQGNKRLEIIRNLSFHVDAGESVAIIGPSGAGKSTLLSMLAGLDIPDAGELFLCGENTSNLSSQKLLALRAQKIGFVFQSFHLIQTFTALENVMLPLVLQGEKDPKPKATQILARLGLEKRIHHLPSALSGGESQRVAIARAIIHKPTVIFADEPSGSLDQNTGEEVMDLLFQEVSSTSLVLVTHNEAFARKCKRVLTLSRGELV